MQPLLITYRCSARHGPTAPTGAVDDVGVWSLDMEPPHVSSYVRCMKDLAKVVMQRIAGLVKISDEKDTLTRTFCSPAMRHANDLVASWMRQAGMDVREDAIGNLIGHYPAATPAPRIRHQESGIKNPASKILLLGSHLD